MRTYRNYEFFSITLKYVVKLYSQYLQIIAKASRHLTVHSSNSPESLRKYQDPETKNSPQKNIGSPKSHCERSEVVGGCSEVEGVGCFPQV